MKNIFLHGLGNRNDYKRLFRYFNVPRIDWNNGSLSKLKLGKPNTLVAHSLGCMIACMHAEKHNVDTLVLCSPTPEETLKKIKAKQLIFLVGEKETWLRKEIIRMSKTLKCSYRIIEVPNTGHVINSIYLKYLLRVL